MTATQEPTTLRLAERRVRHRMQRARRGRTPTRLGRLAGVTVAALAVLFGALAVAAANASDALRVIGHDAGPQVVATTDLYYALSDADAQLANALLLGDEYASRRDAALARYERRRTEVATALLEAHRLAGDDPARQRTIASIVEGFGRYERLAAHTLLLSEQAAHPAGAPPEPVLMAYREATDLMSLELLPQAYNLTLESGTAVRRTYDEARTAAGAGRAVVVTGGLLSLGCLIALQLHLARRFRRVFSPALLMATAVAVLYAATGVTVLSVESGTLQEAKQDGFDSLLSLARTRAVSNSLHADQVRYLIDPERADTYEQIYLDKALSLLYVEAGNLERYYSMVASLASIRPAQIPGLLGSQTGAGSGAAATAALTAYHELQEADRELRAVTAIGGASPEALSLWLGPLSEAFEQYDAALDELMHERRTAFEQAITGGEEAMAGLGFLLPVAMITIAVLVGAGVAPRLHEYR